MKKVIGVFAVLIVIMFVLANVSLASYNPSWQKFTFTEESVKEQEDDLNSCRVVLKKDGCIEISIGFEITDDKSDSDETANYYIFISKDGDIEDESLEIKEEFSKYEDSIIRSIRSVILKDCLAEIKNFPRKEKKKIEKAFRTK
jgi:hypothetical protein